MAPKIDRWTYRLLGVFVLLCVLSESGFGQLLLPRVYSMKDGLPSNDINAIHQDARGFMWFATTNGLSCFDGRNFRNWGLSEGLPAAFVMDVADDSRDPSMMWVLAGGRLCRVSTSTRRCQPLALAGVRAMHRGSDGALWCGTEHGVVRVDGDSIQAFAPAVLGGVVTHIDETADSLLWFSTGNGVVRYERKTGSFQRFDLGGYGEGSVWSMLADCAGNLWLGMGGTSLLRIRDGRILSYRKMNYGTSVLAEDRMGELWHAGYDGAGHFHIGLPERSSSIGYTKENGLTENTIRAMCIDREGNIWIGGRDHGVMKFSELNTFRFPIPPVNAYTLSHNIHYAGADSSGHLWVAGERSIEEIWRDSYGHWHSKVTGLPRGICVRSVFIDNRNLLWTLSAPLRSGPWRLSVYTIAADARGGGSRLRQLSTLNPWPYPDYPNMMIVARDGTLWIGGYGLVRMRVESASIRSVFYGRKDGIPTNYIRELYEDTDGAIWCGTFADGIVRVTPGDSMRIAATRIDSAMGMKDPAVWAITQDRAGGMLAGTARSGIVRLKHGNTAAQTYMQGLPNNAVQCLTRDSTGRIWAGTSVGMSHEDAPGSSHFVTRDIFLGSGVFCCGTTREGLVWYATPSDLWVHDPRGERRRNSFVPPVYITSAKINGLARPIEALDLSHDENNVELSFIGIGFRDEREVRYRYRLLGADSSWNGPTPSNAITFGNLAPGSYRFEVLAVNSEGIESARAATLSIMLRPPYWRRWWFVSGVLLMLVGAIVTTYRFKLSRLREREESAEDFSRRLISQQEAERKRIARELHDGLGQEFIVISNRARRGLKDTDTEQARRQLEAIVEASTRALDNVREIALDLSPYHLEHFGLAATIRSMAQRLAEDGQLDMVLVLADVDARIDKQAHIHIFRIVQEAVTNVIKHARATRATVAIAERGSSIEIRISDNGIGISAGTAAAAPSSRGGLGLPGLAERAKLLGGTFAIDSAPGRGCVVTVILPAGFDPIHSRAANERGSTPS